MLMPYREHMLTTLYIKYHIGKKDDLKKERTKLKKYIKKRMLLRNNKGYLLLYYLDSIKPEGRGEAIWTAMKI